MTKRIYCCGRCGYFTKSKPDMRKHFRHIIPCDSNKIFVVDETIIEALYEDKINFNIYSLPIMKV